MSLSITSAGRTWDEAAAPGAVRLVRRFEAAWREARGRRPDPDDFLPNDLDDRPGARLALLRADLTLRWEAGETLRAEHYQERYPDLDDETLVALIYEEFCLREEGQGTVYPAEYYERFPTVASRLRRVFDIHGLVGSGTTDLSTEPREADGPAITFPEAGQTIAGFHLVEELGRGAFARVFLAHERQLADRPVALKVARTGSREPQTLARLQHTHIVPVHSYRTDPSTGLHLMCMPYFGRVTLSRLLADPKARTARFGSDLVAALDRLEPGEGPTSGRSTGRSALTGRTYSQSIAWWGARMAEALAHAHDRGVLHRDVKPTNVLVTADGMPMLLDFNLAREAVGDAASALGGTLDYMAPEHLEELADGIPGRVDARSDVYGLGVLLFEALAGSRPFPPPQGALSGTEMLLRAAEERRAGPARLTADHPEVPEALEAVVRRCLQPEPADRYETAADLATDLQAVADDLPLWFAREPFPSRAARWLRRNRRPLALALPAVVALAGFAVFFDQSRRDLDRLRTEVDHLIEIGQVASRSGDFAGALTRFETAGRVAEGREDLADRRRHARSLAALARQQSAAHEAAAAFFRAGESLRFRLAGLGGDPSTAVQELHERLRPFYVFESPDWTRLDTLELIDPAARSRLIDEVNELLFLRALALERGGDTAGAGEGCARALAFTPTRGPWLALRDHLAHGPAPDRREERGTSPSESFLWGLLFDREGRSREAIDRIRRSVRRAPADSWRHAYLALLEDRAGDPREALAHADLAVALQPRSPWARFARARIEDRAGSHREAVEDYHQALREVPSAGDPHFESQLRRALSRDSGVDRP